MGKKVMWGLAAAAALALIVMKFTGFPPTGDGTEGTVWRGEALPGAADDRQRRRSRAR
jgi:hypothetical protein